MAKTKRTTSIAGAKAPSGDASAKGSALLSLSLAKLHALVCLLLLIVTLLAYGQVVGCKFITSYDDHEYVTGNRFIASGINGESLRWAFTTFRCSNWHPLTWISHMLDYRFYRLNPAGHHLTNLLFHIANTLLLFLLLSRLTRAVWKSVFVAALFAVHPLHVESVAWVAERKDLLSALFWFLAIYAYTLYSERPGVLRYLAVLMAFALGLLSKPMLVTLPFVLLLLDYWPLGRMNLRWRLVLEKLPLFALSIASSVVTVIAQRSGGAVDTLSNFTLGNRIGNAAISYVGYIINMLWPSKLAVFYPLTGELPLLKAIGAGILLIAVSALVLRGARQRPYLALGWLWYLITLVPVIGLVQVGSQAMADRYTYIPLIGPFIVLAWGIPELLKGKVTLHRLMMPASVLLILVLGACTWVQIGFWHDEYTLFDRAVEVTKNNCLAYNNRGTALMRQGKLKAAIADFTRAIEIQPTYGEAQNNLGFSLIDSGRIDEGMQHVRAAMRLGIDTAPLRFRIALIYCNSGRIDQGIEECQKSLRLDPHFPPAHNLLGTILGSRGKLDECISHLKAAISEAPDYADPHGNLAIAYRAKGDYAAAWREIHLFEEMGGKPRPQFLADLSSKMPDPGR